MISLWLAFYIGHLWNFFSSAQEWWVFPYMMTAVLAVILELYLEAWAVVTLSEYLDD